MCGGDNNQTPFVKLFGARVDEKTDGWEERRSRMRARSRLAGLKRLGQPLPPELVAAATTDVDTTEFCIICHCPLDGKSDPRNMAVEDAQGNKISRKGCPACDKWLTRVRKRHPTILDERLKDNQEYVEALAECRSSLLLRMQAKRGLQEEWRCGLCGTSDPGSGGPYRVSLPEDFADLTVFTKEDRELEDAKGKGERSIINHSTKACASCANFVKARTDDHREGKLTSNRLKNYLAWKADIRNKLDIPRAKHRVTVAGRQTLDYVDGCAICGTPVGYSSLGKLASFHFMDATHKSLLPPGCLRHSYNRKRGDKEGPQVRLDHRCFVHLRSAECKAALKTHTTAEKKQKYWKEHLQQRDDEDRKVLETWGVDVDDIDWTVDEYGAGGPPETAAGDDSSSSDDGGGAKKKSKTTAAKAKSAKSAPKQLKKKA